MDPLGRSGTAFGVLGNQRPRGIAGDIRRQARRKQLRRALLVLLLALVLLALGLLVKVFADGRVRARALKDAHAEFQRGTDAALTEAKTILAGAREDFPEELDIQAGLAVVEAQLFAEYGEDEADARELVEGLPTEVGFDGMLARALVAASDGDLETAQALATELSRDDATPQVANGALWLRAFIAQVQGGRPSPELVAEVAEASQEDDAIALRRMHARLVFESGEPERALEILAEARQRAAEHVGLAADEVLYNALVGQRYGGVADIADQLLEGFKLSARDRAHARLARAVVHVHAGEAQKGAELLSLAWPDLPRWEARARGVALDTALLAGDAKLTREILDAGDVAPTETEIYRAWLRLIEGDVMGSLNDLAKLPQAEPKVALLQGLALVEQARWTEADPWLERADKLLPGRIDVEVARARVEVHIGDAEQALRKLEALAEEEPYAPRAWTGLGEAILAVHRQGKGRSRREAERTFQKAIDRERLPAEAAMLLGEVLDEQRAQDGSSAKAALEAFERAVAINDQLPRYRARLGLYLFELGWPERALRELQSVIERPGIRWTAVLGLIRVQTELAERKGEAPPDMAELFEKATELGAPQRELSLERARVALASGEGHLQKALATSGSLVDADPADVEARILLARTLMAKFDSKEAIRILRRGINETKEPGRLYLEWASIESRKKGKRSSVYRARNAWKEMLEENQPPRILLAAGDDVSRIYQRGKEEKQGLVLGRELTERAPYHSDAWRIRAELQLRAGNTSDAISSSQRSIELDDGNMLAHEIRGHCLVRFGRRDEAKEAYEKALELGKGTSEETRLRENLRRL